MKALKSISMAAFLVFLFLLLPSRAAAQSPKDGEIILTKTAIENLIMGMKSENEGLRKSSIYLAGFYGVEETTDALLEVFNSEKNPQIRIIIALTLYRIGNEKGMNAIYSAAVSDKDKNARGKFIAIYREYVSTRNRILAGK